MRRQPSERSCMNIEDPAVTHQDATIPRGRSRESVRDDDFSSPTTADQPERTSSHNLSVDESKANTISVADDLVSVKNEEMSHLEEEPELESCCLSQDCTCVATTCDVTPPDMDSLASTSCARLSSKPTANDECLLTASCQTQDSGFADGNIKSTTSDVGEDAYGGTQAEEKSHSEKKMHIHHRLQHQGVALEEMELTQDGSAVVGTILVLNECYEKEVAVRHSANEWKTFDDTSAEWLETVEGGAADRFKFCFELPKRQFSLELAVSFNQKWDNNDCNNYCISCAMF